MDYFDVRHISDTYLHGQWSAASITHTNRLAKAFAALAAPLFADATPDEKFRLGIRSDKPNQGKSTFLKSLLRTVYPNEPAQDFHEGFELETKDGRTVLVYDQKRARFMHRAVTLIPVYGSRIKKDFYDVKDQASVHLAEWPQLDTDKNFSALWRLQVLGNGDRQWSLYGPESLKEKEGYEKFFEETSVLEIK